MALFGKRGKTLLSSIPCIMKGPDDQKAKRIVLNMADFRIGEWEELCKDYLLSQAQGREFVGHECLKCGHRTALKLWSERPEGAPDDARRLSFRCTNPWCGETYSNQGLIRQSSEHEILKIIDPNQFTCVPQDPYIPILHGFGDHVQRRERVMLIRGAHPMFDRPGEVVDFGLYGGAWIEVAAEGQTHRVTLSDSITIKRE